MRRILSPSVSVVAVLIAAMLWVLQCSGARPEVVGAATIHPPEAPSQTYRVEATVHNRGPGHGEVHVVFRLRDRARGLVFQEEKTVTFERDATIVVTAALDAPPGTYDAEVETEYPPK